MVITFITNVQTIGVSSVMTKVIADQKQTRECTHGPSGLNAMECHERTFRIMEENTGHLGKTSDKPRVS